MSKSIDGLWRAPLRVLLLAAALVALAAVFAASSARATETLIGNTLLITSGADTGGVPSGSWFRLGVAPVYYSNRSSANRDQTYTLLTSGRRGLRLLTNQEPPRPAFDGSGNALADPIVLPTGFDGINFSVATPAGTPPGIWVNLLVRPATIRVDLTAWTAYWNNQIFNQGALFNATSYNLLTRRIVLDWVAPITTGPFAGYNGYWHIEGRVTTL